MAVVGAVSLLALLAKKETAPTTAMLLCLLEGWVSEFTQLYITHLKGKRMRCSSTAVEFPQPKPKVWKSISCDFLTKTPQTQQKNRQKANH